MRLDQSSWPEIEAYLSRSKGIILPTGSIEQHGPMGLIGTDILCAEAISNRAANLADACVAPGLSYAPAPFNTAFPGTVSITAGLFQELAFQVMSGLFEQGFKRIYVLNGHGANIDPLEAAIADLPAGVSRLRSWWDFDAVNTLRRHLFGEWEGMHATPSEISITQAEVRTLPAGAAKAPPRKLTPGYIEAHSRDRHGPPDRHRADFPDGRVGSHSALASVEHGRALLQTAAQSVAEDYVSFSSLGEQGTLAGT